MAVDIYGSGQRANTNPALTKAIQDAYSSWIADTSSGRTGEDTGSGEYSNLQGIGSGPMFLAKALTANGIDPTPYMNVDLGLLNSVMGYNGVNDPVKALNMISQAGPGWQDSPGYRDAIANAVANDLTPADAQKYKTDYLSSHSAGTNAINNSIKAGLAVMTAMAGAGMAGYGPAASGSGLLGGGEAAAGSGAFGGSGSFAGANAVGAGDLALGSMPQVTASSVGMTGAQAAGAGAVGGATSGLLNAPTMAMPNAVTAADLATTAMPQVTTSSLGAGAGGAAATGAGLMGDAYMPANLGANGANAGGMTGVGGKIINGIEAVTGPISGLTGSTLGNIAGGLLGAAASGDTTVEKSSKNDPWAPAQPYLLANLKKNADLQAQYAATPFNDAQKTAYQNSFNASDNFRNNVAPGLLGMVNSFQPYQRQQTAVGGGYKPAAQGGLMAPNMQAPQSQSIGQIDWSKFLPRA
jgi:hypothetical protein